jgi:hypothetical protein
MQNGPAQVSVIDDIGLLIRHLPSISNYDGTSRNTISLKNIIYHDLMWNGYATEDEMSLELKEGSYLEA